MIINPFKKESTRKKLMNFLPVLELQCENLSDFFKKNVDLVVVDDKLSKNRKFKKGTEILKVKKENHVVLMQLIKEFESNKLIALNWLEDIRPFLLEDGYTKDVYALCDNGIAEILMKYDKVISFMNKYELFTF